MTCSHTEARPLWCLPNAAVYVVFVAVVYECWRGFPCTHLAPHSGDARHACPPSDAIALHHCLCPRQCTASRAQSCRTLSCTAVDDHYAGVLAFMRQFVMHYNVPVESCWNMAALACVPILHGHIQTICTHELGMPPSSTLTLQNLHRRMMAAPIFLVDKLTMPAGI